ncbi:MAG: hypothetical protein WCX46_01145 [Candidatus Paceibacterota bacterium]
MKNFEDLNQYSLWKNNENDIIPTDTEVAEKWAIGELETNSFNLSGQTRINIILVLKGAKPGSQFNVIPQKAPAVKKLLETMGLYYNFFEDKEYDFDKEENVPTVTFMISKDKKILDRITETDKINRQKFSKKDYLKNLDAAGKEEQRKSEIQSGIDFGYPATAVEAFSNGEKKMEWVDLPEEIRDSEIGKINRKFPLFSLSKNNWKEEIEVFKRWISIVKYTSPEIYKQILESKE